MLLSKRLKLRAVAAEDINHRYLEWLNDPMVNQFLETRFSPQSLSSLRAYWEVNHDNPSCPWFALCLRADDLHIGNIKLGPINWIHRRADVSLFIGEKAYWACGYASEAIDRLKDWAFHELDLHKLTAGAYADNLGSIRAFEKSGFVIEGQFRHEAFRDGKRVNIVRLGLLRDEI